jgi:hypothetical protein
VKWEFGQPGFDPRGAGLEGAGGGVEGCGVAAEGCGAVLAGEGWHAGWKLLVEKAWMGRGERTWHLAASFF